MVPEEVIASTVSISLMSMTEVHLCVPFSKNNNLGKKYGITESSATNIAWRGWGRNALIDLFTDTAAKEYYRIPRGHEHISFVFSSAFRDFFS